MLTRITRRTFISLTAGSLATNIVAFAQPKSSKVVLYASNGPELLRYDVDVANAVLTHQDSITLPAYVQYAWPHASRRCLYVICSDGAKRHSVNALRIDTQTGKLSQLAEAVKLPARPIHITTDIPSDYVLIAFNTPSSVRVFRVNNDFSIGDEIPQPGVTDGGIYAHQIRVTPDDRHAILVTRGNSATKTTAEDPGALKMFDLSQGVLSNEASIAPNGGIGFGPRHLDFHPTKPWMYLSLERESKLFMYRLENGRLATTADYTRDTVADLASMGVRQLAGAIHIHPNNRVVYVANRNDATVDSNGKQVFQGVGENTIVVYLINQATGEPTEIQRVDTRKLNPRTFSIDPTGRLMTVQHTLPMSVREGNEVRLVKAGITVFRIGPEGKPTYVRGYDIDVSDTQQMFWGGMVGL